MQISPVRWDDVLLRLGRELKEYGTLVIYLYICFAVILLYTASVLRDQGISYMPYGLAAIKALILAKFILIGNMFGIKGLYKHRPLIYLIVYRSLAYVVILVLLSLVEEIFSGFIRDRSLADSIAAISGSAAFQVFAKCVLLWLILLPIVAVQGITTVLGKERLYHMFFVAG